MYTGQPRVTQHDNRQKRSNTTRTSKKHSWRSLTSMLLLEPLDLTHPTTYDLINAVDRFWLHWLETHFFSYFLL
jgi:hypothetical protein